MAELYDADGNLVDSVFTQEEVDAMKEELENKATLTEDEKRELEDLRKKDFNFKKLRTKAETPPEPKAKPVASDDSGTLLDELKVEDEGLRKKATHFFSKLTQGIDDKDLRKMFMEDAIVLAKRSSPQGDPMSPAYSGASGSRATPSDSPLSDPEVREFSQVFGVDEEDVKKYDPVANRNWKPNLGK